MIRRTTASSAHAVPRLLAALLAAVLMASALALASPGASAAGGVDPSARYRVTFTGDWSAATHPTDYPAAANLSPLTAVTHDVDNTPWESGATASDGVELIAETGDPGVYASEIKALIRSGGAGAYAQQDFDAETGTATAAVEIRVDRDHPYLTLATMLAPSPDWFAGASMVDLRDGDAWKASFELESNVYDAGTDDGVTFESADADTDPPEDIASLRGVAPFEDAKVGTISVELLPDDADTADYRVTFNGTWSAETHPTDYPADAHWSPLTGVTHDSTFIAWASGSAATTGIKNVAETGDNTEFQNEITTAIDGGTAEYYAAAGFDPSAGVSVAGFDITVSESHPYLSLATMAAPSPDWFSGISSFNLREGGEWVADYTREVDPYDAGTDDGTTFASADEPTNPAGVITSARGVAPWADAPVGTVTIQRLDEPPTAAYYRVTFDGDWTADTHPTDYPADANLSPLTAVTHNADWTPWAGGSLASEGIKNIAETGDNSAFQGETRDAIDAGTAGRYEQAGFDPFSGDSTATLDIYVTSGYPYLTLATMLAPSPDWFSGRSAVNLWEGGAWANKLEFEANPYDAGTDSGPTFASDDDPTDPAENIASLRGVAPFEDAPVGKITIERIKAPEPVDDFVATDPARLLDTRIDLGVAEVPQGGVIDLEVVGREGVPADAAAVALNVTTTESTAPSFVTVWPKGADRPTASNLNTNPGTDVPNMVIVGVGESGQVSMYNNGGTVELVADVVGYFPAGSGFTPSVPTRVLDTRDGTGAPTAPIGQGETIGLGLAGAGVVPPDAIGVVLNLTSTEAGSGSFITAWPAGSDRPTASNLNTQPGQDKANLAIVKIGDGGVVNLYNNAGTGHLVGDVLGWFEAGSDFSAIAPTRVLDTRDPGEPDALGQGAAIDVQVVGVNGIPAEATSVAVNITSTNADSGSFITAWPTGTDRPTASVLNTIPGVDVPNTVFVKVGTDGNISLYNNTGTGDLVVDVLGYIVNT